MQHLQAAPEPAWQPPAPAPTASVLPMGMATLLLRFGAAMLSPDSRRLFCPAVALLHPKTVPMSTSNQQYCHKRRSLMNIVPDLINVSQTLKHHAACTVSTWRRPPGARAPWGSTARLRRPLQCCPLAHCDRSPRRAAAVQPAARPPAARSLLLPDHHEKISVYKWPADGLVRAGLFLIWLGFFGLCHHQHAAAPWWPPCEQPPQLPPLP